MAARIEPLLTIADLDALPEDGNHYEIIEGELFVSRAPSLTHQTVVLNLSAEIRSFLLENPLGRVYPGPGVIFSDFSGVIPDIIYISNERLDKIASGDKVAGAPDLVIEVLSPRLTLLSRSFLQGPRMNGATARPSDSSMLNME